MESPFEKIFAKQIQGHSMQREDISKIQKNVTDFFKNSVSQIAKSVQFVKRRSKLDANLFVETLIAGCLADQTISLERLCKLIKERGVTITKQGLHQRFHSGTTELMKSVFNKSIAYFKTQENNPFALLKPFSCIQMIDSSGISLPSKLKEDYKGYGGSGSEAGLKIQVMYDYLQGEIKQLHITPGNKNDQSFAEHLKCVKEKGLYLQDLGYFKLKTFALIMEKQAYFISRYLYPTAIFDENGTPIDLLETLRASGNHYSKTVFLDRDKKNIKVRLIAMRLSDEDVEKRIRKLNRRAQKRGKQPTQVTLEFMQWSIYITNVEEHFLDDEQVYLLYSLRWQIELLFKLFKSEAGLAKISGRGVDRILCEIYAKMICIIMSLYFCSFNRWQGTSDISFQKGYKTFKLGALDFFRALKSAYRLFKYIEQLLSDLIQFALKDKSRKKRLLASQRLVAAIE